MRAGILVCQIKVGDLKKVFSLMFVRFLHWRFFNIIHEILKNVKRKIIVIYLHSTFSVFSLRIFYVGPKNSQTSPSFGANFIAKCWFFSCIGWFVVRTYNDMNSCPVLPWHTAQEQFIMSIKYGPVGFNGNELK